MVSLSLRARVALAFLLTTALAMLALGLFVQWRVEDALDEGLRDQLEVEMGRLVAVPPAERAAAVERLSGEIHGQLQDEDRTVVASSPAIQGRMIDPAETGEGYADVRIRVVDEDEDEGDEPETETEPAIALVRGEDGQVLALAIGREDADDAVAEVRTQLLISGPIALVVAGGLGYLVAGLGLRPVERMRSRAATISSRSAGERLPVPPAAELRRLAETLNAMLERLDDGLRRERQFVAEASHDLRTPLALMQTELELALSRPRTSEELAAALRSTEEEVRRLIALAEDLLERAAVDGGGLPVVAEPFDLAAVAEDVVRRFRPRALADARTILLAAPGPVTVVGDREHLRRVLSNLVDNALRHGAGDIEVAADSGDDVVLTVADRGPGFDLEGSAGLGLSIVTEIVRAHGGAVRAVREQDRTVVRVSLPLLDPPT